MTRPRRRVQGRARRAGSVSAARGAGARGDPAKWPKTFAPLLPALGEGVGGRGCGGPRETPENPSPDPSPKAGGRKPGRASSLGRRASPWHFLRLARSAAHRGFTALGLGQQSLHVRPELLPAGPVPRRHRRQPLGVADRYEVRVRLPLGQRVGGRRGDTPARAARSRTASGGAVSDRYAHSATSNVGRSTASPAIAWAAWLAAS